MRELKARQEHQTSLSCTPILLCMFERCCPWFVLLESRNLISLLHRL